MTILDKIGEEQLQYDISRGAGNILILSSGKINKYKYLTGEEILPPNQKLTLEKVKFANFPFRKASEKQTEKKVGALKSLNPSNKKAELKQI